MVVANSCQRSHPPALGAHAAGAVLAAVLTTTRCTGCTLDGVFVEDRLIPAGQLASRFAEGLDQAGDRLLQVLHLV